MLPTPSRPRGRCGHRLSNWVDDVTGVSSRARSTPPFVTYVLGAGGTLKRLASVSGLHSDKSLPPPSRLGFRFARFQLAEVYRGLKILNGTVWK